MTPFRLMLAAVAIAVVTYLALWKSSGDPREAIALYPGSTYASNPPVDAIAAALVGPPELEWGAFERKSAGMSRSIAIISSSLPPTASPNSDSATGHGAIQALHNLAKETAELDAEMHELYRSLEPLIRDAFEAAWNSNDVIDISRGYPPAIETDGMLVSTRHPDHGPSQMVILPRAGFEEAYRIFDLIGKNRRQVKKKEDELLAIQASYVAK